MDTKPGIKTTEFWVTILCQIVGVLVTTGTITPEQQSALAEAITKLGGLITMVASAFGYAISRGNAKRQ